MHTKGTTRGSWLFVAITVAALLAATAGVARAQVSGAIYTTTATGADVNGNIYTAKTDVYINGGPQNVNDPGLVPTGFSTDTPAYVTYVFQVTDPSGAVLLSTDDYTCREVLVQDGRIVGATGSCPHALGTFDFANGEQPVQLAPYNDTPNPGGEYKAWLTPLADYKEGCPAGHASYGFCDKDSKTDNFKIHKSGVANVTVCKFNDLSNDGTQNPGDPLIPGWPITATGVDSGGPTVTGRDGCASFTVSSFTDGSASVTLTEGTLDAALWAQTAPANGTCTLTGADSSVPNSNDTCSVAGGTSSTLPSANGVITLTVGPDDNVIAPASATPP